MNNNKKKTTLTPSQTRVVEYPYRPATTLKVIAGPGSGKTLTLLHKVRHLILSGQVRPDEILILSLTNKAVDTITCNLLSTFEEGNLYESIDNQLKLDELKEIVEQIGIYTIHGLANRVVIENEGIVTIIEENGWRGLLKLLPSDFWQRNRRSLNNNINGLTRQLQKILQEYKGRNDQKLDIGKNGQVIEKLVQIMNSGKVFTNDDLILKATQHLESPITLELDKTTMNVEGKEDEEGDASFTEKLLSKYKVVLIDEYQDLYPSLLPIIEKISKGKQLLMFGDTNQSIYGFLGDNEIVMKSLDNLHEKEKSETLHLYDNFRCTPEIISSANKIISNANHLHNTHSTAKDLILKPLSNYEPQVHEIDDPIDELETIVDQIIQHVCSGAKFSDIAILSRTNNHIQSIADHLTSYGIPFEKLTIQPDWINDIRIQFILDLMKMIMLSSRERLESINDGQHTHKWQSDFNVIVTLSSIKGIGNQSLQTLYSDCNREGISLWKYISEIPKSKWNPKISNKKKIEQYTTLLKPWIESEKIWQMDNPGEILKIIIDIVYQLDYDPLKFKTNQEMKKFRNNLEEMFKIMKLSKFNQPQDQCFVEWFLETCFEQSIIFHRAKLETETNPESLGSIKLSTIHSSKGLEFPIVILSNGPFGLSYPIDDKSLYVGMTRARTLLNIINTKHPNLSKPIKSKVALLSSSSPLETSPLLANKQFWEYYNNDLRRDISNLPSFDTNMARYKMLQTKFGINNGRSFSTLCSKTISLTKRFL
ncbi:ATP-dependent 3'-5' DNA helicase NDAI_0G04310 [Naumovozyma dairenensis CBS 421]|uniref:DNA 3'-5' helicase n=1 Tax=Naumovozyma dairenensis (strain ATCC 10597 / BCRC 20456 / CBS 421 / NBRC 0211 / NRRL Y-12639) TaxID=1071378 RepID=J7S4F0_NAUDC|nr:hypothetical protein NDAI_0G04310 [Naumovozyma dairenensis CBS 421]CCK73416.1 hypothetical protein NDAI_0G04310 [Naumovozyma dairenensis CBS 421]